jgi:hypothetical protein
MGGDQKKSATSVTTRKWTMDLTRDPLEDTNQLILTGSVSGFRQRKNKTGMTRKWTMDTTRDPLEDTNQLILAGSVSGPHLFLLSRQFVLPSYHWTRVSNIRVNTKQRKRHQIRVIGYLSTCQDF